MYREPEPSLNELVVDQELVPKANLYKLIAFMAFEETNNTTTKKRRMNGGGGGYGTPCNSKQLWKHFNGHDSVLIDIDNEEFVSTRRVYARNPQSNDNRYFCGSLTGLNRDYRNYLNERMSTFDIRKCWYSLLLSRALYRNPSADLADSFIPVRQFIESPEPIYLEQFVANKDAPMLKSDSIDFKTWCNMLITGGQWYDHEGKPMTSLHNAKQIRKFPLSTQFWDSVQSLLTYTKTDPVYIQQQPRQEPRSAVERTKMHLFITGLESEVLTKMKLVASEMGIPFQFPTFDGFESCEVSTSKLAEFNDKLHQLGVPDLIQVAQKSKQQSVQAMHQKIADFLAVHDPLECLNAIEEDVEEPEPIQKLHLHRFAAWEREVFDSPEFQRLVDIYELDQPQGDRFSLFKTLYPRINYWYKLPSGLLVGPLTKTQMEDSWEDYGFDFPFQQVDKKTKEEQEVIKPIPFISSWMKFPYAKWYEGYGWYPDPREIPPHHYNTFTGFKIDFIDLTDAHRSDPDIIKLVDFFFYLVDYNCGDSVTYREFLRWIYFKHKYRGHKTRVLIFLYSSMKGTGKSTITTVLQEQFGRDITWQPPMGQLFEKHNAKSRTSILTVLEEEAIPKEEYCRLRSMITQDIGSTRAMCQDSVTTADHTDYICSTNLIPFIDKNERRMVVIECRQGKLGEEAQELCGKLKRGDKREFAWKLIIERILNDPANHVDIDYSFEERFPRTDAYSDAAYLSEPAITRFIRETVIQEAWARTVYSPLSDSDAVVLIQSLPTINQMHPDMSLQIDIDQFMFLTIDANGNYHDANGVPRIESELQIPAKKIYRQFVKYAEDHNYQGEEGKDMKFSKFEHSLASYFDLTLSQRNAYGTLFNQAGAKLAKGNARFGKTDSMYGDSIKGYSNCSCITLNLPCVLNWMYITGRITKNDIAPFLKRPMHLNSS